jgi:hypothetical protein
VFAKRVVTLVFCAVGAFLFSTAQAHAASTPACAWTPGAHDVLVGSVNVDSSSTTGTSYTLPSSGNYRFVACGTWNNTSHGVVDAAYNAGDSFSWTSPNPAVQQGWSLDGYALGPNWGELQVNGVFVPWGAYNVAHVYSTTLSGATGATNFRIFDGDSTTPSSATPNPGFYPDNSGSLSVDIYETMPGSSVIPSGAVSVNWTQGGRECDSFFTTSGTGEIDQYWAGAPACPVPVAGYPSERVAFHTTASGVPCNPAGLLSSGQWTFSYSADGGYADLTNDAANLDDFLTVGTQYLVCYYPLQSVTIPTTAVNWLQAGKECDSYMSKDGPSGVVQQWWNGAPACPQPVPGYAAVRVVFYPAAGGATCDPVGLLRSADWTFTYSADGGYTELTGDGGNLSDFLAVGATYLICYYPVSNTVVAAQTVDHFASSALPAGTFAVGQPFSFSVSAFDSAGKLVSGYNGVATISDLTGDLATTTVTFRNGVAAVTDSVGVPALTDVVNVGDGVHTPSKTRTFAVVGPVDHFASSALPTGTFPMGQSFSFSVSAFDSVGNVATGYNGVATISDLTGHLATTTVTFTNGVAAVTDSVGVPAATDVVSVGDGVHTPSKTRAFAVVGPVDHFASSALPTGTFAAGHAFSFSVSAFDSAGNVATGYNGVATISDLTGHLGTTSVTFTNGVASVTDSVGVPAATDVVSVGDGVHAPSKTRPFAVT